MAVRILLADDHPLTRSGIAEFVRRESTFELVAEAEDGISAWEMIQELRPDVALLDIRMPGLDGVAVAQKVKNEGMNTAIVMLTSYDAQQYVIASLRAGARGFVLKTVSPKELTTAINTVAKGGLYLDPEVASVMGEQDFIPEQLSVREREKDSAARKSQRNFSSVKGLCRLILRRYMTSWDHATRRKHYCSP